MQDEVALICPHCGQRLELTGLQRERAMLLMTLAHEINTPLTAILANSANLLDEVQEKDPKLKALAEHNINQVRRLNLMTETIMTALSGQLPKREFSSHSIFRPLIEACEMFQTEAASKGTKILEPKAIDSKFPEIEMSLFDLTLAFKNIIHNAVKYSHSSTTRRGLNRYISVTGTWADAGHHAYSIHVQNYGVGISDDEIRTRAIFQPFYRGDAASDRHRTGAGLGLAHARQIVEDLHHGSIEVKSEPIAENAFLTTFTVTIPIKQPQKQ